MSIKSSISLSEQQDAFARSLVEQGRFSSLSAVLQNGLELLRQKTEADEMETAALRALLAERRSGAFLSAAEMQSRTAAMTGRKRRAARVAR